MPVLTAEQWAKQTGRDINTVKREVSRARRDVEHAKRQRAAQSRRASTKVAWRMY